MRRPVIEKYFETYDLHHASDAPVQTLPSDRIMLEAHVA
jgi:hypothetical protein